jgi:perosamine synthetase
MERLDDIMAKRDRVAQLYNQRLAGLPTLKTPSVEPGVRLSWFVYVVQLSEAYTQRHRNRILAALRQRGVGCNDYFTPIHLQPMYRELGYKEGDYPVTEFVAARTIALPFYGDLGQQDVDYVVEQLRDLL